MQTLQNGSYKVKTHKGITMIELIIALSILAMAIGVCITNYFKFYDSWTNSTSVDLCNNYILHMINYRLYTLYYILYSTVRIGTQLPSQRLDVSKHKWF